MYHFATFPNFNHPKSTENSRLRYSHQEFQNGIAVAVFIAGIYR